MSTSELDSRNIAISMRKSVENLVISSQDAIGQSISQALTFSGVIAQHTNQIIQDTKNMSRSPSPSLRNLDTGLDTIENDKGGEMAIQVPCHAAGDGGSVSSASDSALPQAGQLRGENPKVTSPAGGARGGEAAGAGGGTRSKKKSWYNSLYPTYKSKSDDFKRLFKDLPDDERLIVDYSCALQKDILVHGRLYASQNYLCFYASIFGWETSMSLRWKDVTAITKEKTALVIPNAILVCTEGEKNFLTSFSGRDKAYLMLFRVWQNALMDQPMTSQEIWQWVHSCYGEELGFNSDDEGYSRDLPLPLAVDAVPLIVGDVASEELLDSSMEAGAGGSSAGGSPRARTPRTPHPIVLGRDSSPPLVTNGETEYGPAGEAAGRGEGAARDGPPTDMSDTSDSEPEKHHDEGSLEKCTSSHSGKLVMRQQFPYNIDQLFTMIFTNSKFYLELLAVRGTTDYVQAPWQPQGGLKCRQVSYTLGLTSGPIGPKVVHVTETQVMNKCSKPGCLYSIDASSENTGIPYADYFTVEAHYCLHRVSEHLTDLALYGHIKYKKNMWPMVKAFLEKNAMSGLDEYARLIEARLAAEAEGAAPAARKRRHRRLTTSSQETVSANATRASSRGGSAASGLSPAAPHHRARAPHARAPPAPARAAPWLPAALLALLAINALLYWRLYHKDKAPRTMDMDDLQNRMRSVSGAQMADWSALLEAHTQRQRAELGAWRDALDTTVAHLAQTELALRKLLETIKPSLEKAERDADFAAHDDARSDYTRSGEARSGEARSGEARSGEARSGEVRSEGTREMRIEL